MRSVSILLTLMVAFALQAAPPNFTVQAPKWTRLATGDEVVIYKSPVSTAPKLIFNWETMIGYNPYTSTKWSSAPLTQSEEYLYMKGITPIISEKNGWYEIPSVNIDNDNGWVKESSCFKMTPLPIIVGRDVRDNFIWVDSYGDPDDGNYAMFLDPDPRGFGTIYLGRELDGMVICPYLTQYTLRMTEDLDTFDIGDFEIKCKDGNLRLSKLPYDVLKKIFQAAEKVGDPVVIIMTPSSEYQVVPFN